MSSPLSPPPTDPPPSGSHTPREAPPRSERVVEAIMFTDIEGSVGMEQTLGTERYAALLTRHGELFYEAIETVISGKIEKHTGDGFMARFERPSDAVAVALRFQSLVRAEPWGEATGLRVRIGIHQGEVLRIYSERQVPSSVGAPVNLAARIMALAEAGQILLTRAVFDSARQFIKTIPAIAPDAQAVLRWEAHGAYLVKGLDDPVEIFEVGERGRAPFHRPKDNANARRSVLAEDEDTLGWRPAKGLEVPRRRGWVLERSLGEGGFGEVWLAHHRTLPDSRVFKFCFDSVRLRSFKREVLLFRLIRQALGPRHDIATLYDVQLDAPPFFLESAYCPGGILSDWLKRKMEAGEVPLTLRLTVVAQIARALHAAHSVGIIHKDVKPSNIFIEEGMDGIARPRLADFGIGVVQDRSLVEGFDLTYTIDLTTASESSRTGTRMYSAPEYTVGAPPSIQGDIYSLGVVLFQMVVGDFTRLIGPGWQRDVQDSLLADDIASCVDVEPARRFASALQVAENLEALDARRAAQAATEEAARREEAQARETERQRRRMRAALTISATALAIVGALCVVVWVELGAKRAALRHADDIAAEREVARDRLYVADLQAATESMLQRRSEAARELVARHRPAPGERDRRGWEWFFADSVLNTNHLSRAAAAQPLRALAVSADETQAAVAGDDGDVTIWSCDTLEKTRTWQIGTAVRCLAWSQRSGLIAAGLANGEVVCWNPATQLETGRWQAHKGAVASLDWHPFEPVLMTGGTDGAITCWLEKGQAIRETTKQGTVRALEWKPDGTEIAVVLGQPARLLAGAAETLETGHEYALSVEESALAWRPRAHEVAIAMNGLPLRSWNPYTCVHSFSLASHFTPGACAYAWSPAGAEVAVGSIDGRILLVDSHRLAESSTALHGHRGRVAAMRWLGKKKERLLSVGEDGTLRGWDDLRRSPQVATIPFPTVIADAQWHPSENRLAVLLAGDEVQVVSGETWTPQWSRPMPAPRDARTPFLSGRLAWSPDGHWLASACPGRAAAMWRLEDGASRLLASHQDATEVHWMADSCRLLVRSKREWACVSADSGEIAPIPGTERALWVGSIGGEQLGIVAVDAMGLRYFTSDLAGKNATPGTALPVGLGAVRASALSGDRTLLAIAGETGQLVWLDTRTGAWHRPALAHAGPVRALAWHPDRSRLASVGADSTARIFNIAQTAQNWVIEHKLAPDVAAVGWSADGRRLTLASTPERLLKIYDASSSLHREQGEPAPENPLPSTQRLAEVCGWIERHPAEEFGWEALAQEVRERRGEGANSEADLLLAAAELGVRGWFSPLPDAPEKSIGIVKRWHGVALPRALQIAQACALPRWDEALALCQTRGGESGAAWCALAKAEALARLGRRTESEAANLEAWKLLQRESNGPAATQSSPTTNLSPWANIRLTDDWSSGENNNLAALPARLPQPEGYSFQPRDFIQLAGKCLRQSGGRMLPRGTGWIFTGRPAHRLAFLTAACDGDAEEPLQDICIGSLFLLREGGAGAVRVPLIYGRNVWNWWVPTRASGPPPAEEAVAWRGSNPHAHFKEHKLALFRLHWDAGDNESPVTAISILSHMRRPAPMLVAVEER